MIELKACPFCGFEDVIPIIPLSGFAYENDERKLHTVYCTNCGASGPTTDTEEEAVKRWNGGKQ